MNLRTGQIIDFSYRIEGLIGAGGMGTVYRARELSLDRLVALKVICADQRQSETVERFRRESVALSVLDHPAIVRVYKTGFHGSSSAYIAMEYVSGLSLRQFLEQHGPVPWVKAVQLLEQLCAALAQAHAHGIIHRDLKPANILLTPEQNVKVLDFGLCKLVRGEVQKLTLTGSLIGSVFYMSPEQCLGGNVDRRSDIYSLGITLYELLCGRPPFTADNPVAMLHMHLHEVPPSPQEVCPELSIPDDLSDIIMKMIAKDPAERFQHVSEILEDLSCMRREKVSMLSGRQRESRLDLSVMLATLVGMAVTVSTLADPGPATVVPALTGPPDSGAAADSWIKQAMFWQKLGRDKAATLLLKEVVDFSDEDLSMQIRAASALADDYSRARKHDKAKQAAYMVVDLAFREWRNRVAFTAKDRTDLASVIKAEELLDDLGVSAALYERPLFMRTAVNNAWWQEAIVLAKRIMERFPESPEGYAEGCLTLGFALMASGSDDAEKGSAMIKKYAPALEKDHVWSFATWARCGRARYLMEKGQVKEAADECNHLASMMPLKDKDLDYSLEILAAISELATRTRDRQHTATAVSMLNSFLKDKKLTPDLIFRLKKYVSPEILRLAPLKIEP